MKTQELAIERHLRRTLPTRRELVATLFRQRLVMLGAFALVVLATIVAGLWVPKYDAHMKILVTRERSNSIVTSSNTEPVQFSNDPVTEEDLNTEVELLNSDDLLRRVVLSTGLAGKSVDAGSPRGQIKVARAVGQLYKDLVVEAVHKSNIITVHYKASSPQKGQEVLSALAAAYLKKHLEARHASTEVTFFNEQAKEYEKGLNNAQQKLVDFTRKTGVVSSEIERDEALRQESTFDAAARQAKTSAHEAEQRIHTLEAQLKETPHRISTVVRTSDNAQLLEQLKSTKLTLELKRTELLTKYEPTYRPVQELDRQIKDTDNAIQREESNRLRDESSDENPTYQSVEAELIKARADLSGYNARAGAASEVASHFKQAAEVFGKSGVEEQDLKRIVKTQEENYLLYEHKSEEARINEALDQRGILNIAIGEQPTTPVLHNRSRMNLAFLTVLLGGAFSIASAFVADFLDPTFRTPGEVSNYLDVPVLAALPRGSNGNNGH